MSGFQHFIQQRKSIQKDSHRQEISNKLKLPVPVAKLEQDGRQPISVESDNGVVARRNLARPDPRHHRMGLRSDQISMGPGDGFDTDTEGLDDTTSIKSTYDDKIVKGIEPSLSYHGEKIVARNDFDQKARIHHHSSFKQSWNSWGSDPLLIDNAGSEVEDRSEGKIEEEGQGLTEEVTPEPDSPHLSQNRHEMDLPSKESVFGKLTETPAISEDFSRNFEGQRSEHVSSFSRRVRKFRSNGTKSNVRLRQGDKSRTVVPTILSKLGYNDSGPVDLLARSNPSIAFQGIMPVNHQVSQSPSVMAFQPQSQGSQATEQSGNVVTNTAPSPLGSKPTAETRKLRECLNNVALLNDGRVHSPFSPRSVSQINEESLITEKACMSKSFEPKHAISDKNTNFRKHSRELDYSFNQLAGMKFHILRDEPFHIDPQNLDEALPLDIVESALTVRLDYLLRLEDHNARISQQGAFFKSIPIKEYEECGDFIVERFGALIKKFQNARQERRKAAKDFEEEISRREEIVRGKINAFDADFDRLKRSGEDVVRKRLAS